jgi:hypothetical protein
VLLNALISVILSFLVFWIPYAKTRWQKQRNGPVTQSVDSHTESEAEAEEELTPVENLVLTLCDLNLVTSLGLIISSLSKIAQDNQYPLYHIFLARSLANLAILGHNASSFVYKKMRSCKKWSLYLRWFLSAVAVVLYLCWSAITLHRFEAWESRDGRSYTPECFSTHRYTFPMPGSMSFWIWVNIFWIPSGYIWILAYPFSDVIHNALVGLDDLTVWMLRKLSETKFAVSNPRRTLKKVLSLALQVAQVLLMVALVALWFHLNLLLPADLVTPITYFVFGIAWNGYDICAIKRSNLNAVVGVLQTASPAESTNPETEFGIGQILPIIMILQVVLSLLDVLAGE